MVQNWTTNDILLEYWISRAGGERKESGEVSQTEGVGVEGVLVAVGVPC
jgi:hypothetical protein